MNTLPYLPTYLTLVSSVYLFHTRNVSFSHFSTFCFPIAMALIIITLLDYMLCLARQAYLLGTSLSL